MGGGLRVVSLLFIQKSQLVERERDQIMVEPDLALAEGREKGYLEPRPLLWVGVSVHVLPGEHVCEAQLGL